MTLAQTLNDEVCSCGLENGRTWFQDSNGNQITEVGGYTLFENDNEDVEVTLVKGQLCVGAVDIDGNPHEAVYGDDFMWYEPR